ncbi:MAG: hypothetical protein JXQ29_04895, partial [Planctomycetes bacterium]|nr:hypothetical protein [Planctomycetota bacterium]
RLPLIGEAGNIKYPAPIVTVSLAALAAIGHDRLRSRLAQAQSLRGFYAVGALLVLVGVAAPAAVAAAGLRPIDVGACALAGALVVAAFAFVRLAAQGAVSPRALSAALLALSLAALWANHADLWTPGDGGSWERITALGGARGGWAAAVAVGVSALLCARARWGGPLRRWQAWAAAGAILAIVGARQAATVRVVVPPPHAQRPLPDPAEPPEFIAAICAENERLGGGPFRIAGEPTALPANQATVYGLEDVRSFDALYVDRFFQVLNVINDWPDYREVLFPLPARITQQDALKRLRVSQSDWWFFEQTKRTAIRPDRFAHPLVALLGVRFFLYGPYRTGPILEGAGYRTVYDRYGYRVVASEHAAPRAFLVHRWEVLDSRRAVKARLGEADFDGRRLALLERAPPGAAQGAADGQAPDEVVRIVERSTSRMQIAVEAKTPGILVVTDNFFPGWEAEIARAGGAAAPAEILASDLAFRGVYVPAGAHVVRLHYRPHAWRWGAWAGLLTLVLLVGAWLGPAAWRRVRGVRVPAVGAGAGGG